MEQMKSIKNCFVSPVQSFPASDPGDDLIEVYELVDHVVMGPSGDKTDFILQKKPVLVDSYHLYKVIQERAKGQDLKSLIARCEKIGDDSSIHGRSLVFGDEFIQPNNLGDALDLSSRGEDVLSKLDEDTRDKLISLSKGSKDEFESYINDLVDKKLNSSTTKKDEVINDGN